MTKRPTISDTNKSSGLIGLGPIPGMAPVAAFNRDQIESLLITKGLNAIHYKHALNPDMETTVGTVNPNTQEAQWGVRFFEARPVKIIPQNFSLENRLNVQGIWGMHTVMINITGYYMDLDKEGKKEVIYAAPGDLIVIGSDSAGNSVTSEVRQRFEYNPNGPMKLNFRIESVRYLADKDKKYEQDQDFTVLDGKIVWLSGSRRPSFQNGKGAVLSIVYEAKPVYIVKNVPHSIRILPSNNIGHGAMPREAMYAPQMLIAQQAWIRQDNQDLLNFSDLPEYPGYKNSPNVTGGTF